MDEVGFTLGKYQILREIGRGGMGVVYLAEDKNLKRSVALKTLRPTLGSNRKHLERFLREGQAVGSLNHPNIVHINALEIIDDQIVIEMPYFSRGSMRDFIGNATPPRDVVRLLRDVLMALECCHEAGIIHRDVKPNNLLLDDGGRILLTDFGIAALLDAEWQSSLSGDSTSLSFAGTPLYMSPGAWEGATPTPHHDLYALGIIAREALVGAPPFKAPSPLAMMRTVLENDLPPIRDEVPELSVELGALIDGLTLRSEEARKTTATQVLHLLRDTREYESPDSNQAITMEMPRALSLYKQRTGPTTTAALRSLWHRWYGHFLVAILAAVVGLLIGLYPQEWASETMPGGLDVEAVPAVRQIDLTADSLPTESALLTTRKVLNPRNRRVLGAISSTQSGTPFSVLLQVEDDDNVVNIVAYHDNALWGFELGRESEDTYALDGTWAQYATADGKAFRWATLAGRAHWSGDLKAPIWIHIDGKSQSDVGQWSETWMLTGAVEQRSDTAFLYDLEATPDSLAIIYNELPARIQAEPWNFRAVLPSLFDGRLNTTPILQGTSIDLDGRLEEALWASPTDGGTLAGAPTHAGATLRAFYQSDALLLGIQTPFPLKAHWAIDIAFVERFSVPLSESTWILGHWDKGEQRLQRIRGEEATPANLNWKFQAQHADEQFTAELRIPFEQPLTGERSATPTPRLNIRISTGETPESLQAVVQWGWPEVSAFAHGVEIALSPAATAGPPP